MRLDWLTIRTSAIAGLIIVLPSAILSEAFVGDDGAPGWTVFFSILILVGFVIAGFGAGRLRDDTPMIHGAMAALVCWAVVQFLGAVRRLIAGDPLNLAGYPVIAAIAMGAGIIGAMFAGWSGRRTGRGIGSGPPA